jgi:hypothetical protein
MESFLIEQYLELGLRLGKLVPDFVDSYYGPPEIRDRVDREPNPDPGALSKQARDLALSIEAAHLDKARARWLRAQITGLGTSADLLAGRRLSYREQVEGCHGVRPAFAPEDVFADAHRRLGDVLPGRGSLAARYRRWLSSQAVSGDAILLALRSLADRLREETGRLLALPEGEKVEFKLVRGKRWFGFASYQGALRSEISINVDLPVRSFELIGFVAHEVYPGHHTEHVLKEDQLVRRHGYLEETVRFLGTPQSVLSEGLAQLALQVVLPKDADAIAAEHLRSLGIPYDEKIARTAREAKETLRFMRPNILLLIDRGEMSVPQAHAYARRWMLEPDDYVDKAFDSLLRHPWRSYESCYTDGFTLCQAFVDGDPQRFARLITEQLTPSGLLGAIANRDAQ